MDGIGRRGDKGTYHLAQADEGVDFESARGR